MLDGGGQRELFGMVHLKDIRSSARSTFKGGGAPAFGSFLPPPQPATKAPSVKAKCRAFLTPCVSLDDLTSHRKIQLTRRIQIGSRPDSNN